MKNQLRSYTSTQGRRMAGAHALWRANLTYDESEKQYLVNAFIKK